MAVNILMVNMLEEMNASEQLWASHTGGSKLSAIVCRYHNVCFLLRWLRNLYFNTSQSHFLFL